jgi:hypothetical protein
MLDPKVSIDLQKITGDDFNDLPDQARQLLRDLLGRINKGGMMNIEDLCAGSINATSSPKTTNNGLVGGFFNLIPSSPNNPVSCSSVVVAVSKRYLPGYNMGRVLRLVRGNLIACGTGTQSILNRTLLIFTDHLDRRSLYESRLDMEQHFIQGGLRYAILYWNGHSWTREYF